MKHTAHLHQHTTAVTGVRGYLTNIRSAASFVNSLPTGFCLLGFYARRTEKGKANPISTIYLVGVTIPRMLLRGILRE